LETALFVEDVLFRLLYMDITAISWWYQFKPVTQFCVDKKTIHFVKTLYKILITIVILMVKKTCFFSSNLLQNNWIALLIYWS